MSFVIQIAIAVIILAIATYYLWRPVAPVEEEKHIGLTKRTTHRNKAKKALPGDAVIFWGMRNAGKTRAFLSLTGRGNYETVPSLKFSVGEAARASGDGTSCWIWDCPGDLYNLEAALSDIKMRLAGAVYFVDLSCEMNMTEIASHFLDFARHVGPSTGFLLCGTKTDV